MGWSYVFGADTDNDSDMDQNQAIFSFIKCPVCMDALTLPEWRLWVDQATVDLFETRCGLDAQFKALHRFCPECGDQVDLVKRSNSGDNDIDTIHQQLLSVAEQFLELIGNDNASEPARDSIGEQLICLIERHTRVDLLSQDEEGPLPSKVSMTQIYRFIVDEFMLHQKKSLQDVEMMIMDSPVTRSKAKKLRLEGLLPTPDSPNGNYGFKQQQLQNLNIICANVITLCDVPAQYRLLQFEYLKLFPVVECNNHMRPVAFCFKCCDISHGIELMANPESPVNCLDWMYQISRNTELKDSEYQKIIQWKYFNSKPCPRCHTLIERDEGCNKVDCTMCGFKFCWLCMNKWGGECSYYRCVAQPVTPLNANSSQEHIKDKETENTTPTRNSIVVTELGVPDVFKIEQRLSSLPNSPISATAPGGSST
ncbi:hypothetical protein MIR68_011164 [Amoeboaphelidium protococcarum]|nr:hypothetical protein MIR68_011164 [Amoeboaphelidium protococcarum]